MSPGYFILRTRFDRSTSLLFAFPASVVLLHASVLALQLLTGTVSGIGAVAVLAFVFVAALVTSRHRASELWPALRTDAEAARAAVGRSLRDADRRSWALAVLVLALIVVVSVDFGLDPLRRMDNTFRWRNLAERMFALRTMSFYPPRTAADFSTYFLPDGIAPELSISYWWCFTLGGSYTPLNALGFIQLEALWLVLMIAALARDLGGAPAYRRGVALACCAMTPLNAISCGSESGLLAIGTVGALHALLQPGARSDDRGESMRWSCLAIVSASLAALAREYGPLTLAMTLAVLVLHRRPVRELATAGALALVLAGTWYLRTWVRSGNPFYIHEMGGIFPGIPVFTHYYKHATQNTSVFAMPRSELMRLVFWLFYGAPLAWILGGAAAIRRPRHVTVLFAAAWFVVYLYATKFSSGGYGFALRVASPTIAILTALGAAFVPARLLRSLAGAPTAAVIALLFVKTTTDLIGGGGGRAWRVPLSQIVRPVEQFPWPIDDRVAAELRAHGGRVLSDNGHLTPVMRAFAIDLVPVWSPDVRFLFDPAVPADELRSRLRALHLRVVTPMEWEQFASGDRARVLTETFASWRALAPAAPRSTSAPSSAAAAAEPMFLVDDP